MVDTLRALAFDQIPSHSHVASSRPALKILPKLLVADRARAASSPGSAPTRVSKPPRESAALAGNGPEDEAPRTWGNFAFARRTKKGGLVQLRGSRTKPHNR